MGKGFPDLPVLGHSTASQTGWNSVLAQLPLWLEGVESQNQGWTSALVLEINPFLESPSNRLPAFN